VIRAAIVGTEVGPLGAEVDARWLMAYAAGLGETDARYYDTRRADGVTAHPLFPVCYEWPVALAMRANTIDDALAPLSVHATHHLTVHRPPRAGDRLLTSARVVAVTPRRGGTLVVTRFTTVDERGAPVTTTEYGSVYRGVPCDGEAHDAAAPVGAWTTRRARREPEPGGAKAVASPRWSESVSVAAWAAHVYTECARIWNPIHTDTAVAAAAGLPAIILHGTATLALAISRVVARELDGDPTRVAAVSARFTGMVPLPATFTVRGFDHDPAARFDAVDAAGAPVLGDGELHTRQPVGGESR
jgi:acyl dehydratase